MNHSSTTDNPYGVDRPAGETNAAGDKAAGQMPGGDMYDASKSPAAETAKTDMPSGNMNAASEATAGRMLGSGMQAEATTSPTGMAIADMPSGGMAEDVEPEAEAGNNQLTLEISGEWQLTLSPASRKNSK